MWTVELFKQSLRQLWPRQTNDAQKYPHAQLGNVSVWGAIPNMQFSYLPQGFGSSKIYKLRHEL